MKLTLCLLLASSLALFNNAGAFAQEPAKKPHVPLEKPWAKPHRLGLSPLLPSSMPMGQNLTATS